MAELTLKELLRSLGRSVTEADEMVQFASVEHYLNYFQAQRKTSKSKGKKNKAQAGLVPRVLKMALPASDGTYQVKDIPVAALIHHTALKISDVKIRMNLLTRWDEQKKQVCVNISGMSGQQADEAGFDRLPQEMEISFKGSDSPEGIQRLTTQIHSII